MEKVGNVYAKDSQSASRANSHGPPRPNALIKGRTGLGQIYHFKFNFGRFHELNFKLNVKLSLK